MNKYLIRKKIITPVHIFDPKNIRGFKFYKDHNKPLEHSIEVSKEINATDFQQANNEFFNELIPILELISVFTQCEIDSISKGSYVILNLANKNVLQFCKRIDNDPVGLDISDTIIQDIKSFIKSGVNLAGITFLSEAIRAKTRKSKLMLLISAAESFAGSGTKKGNCTKRGEEYKYPCTDEDNLKKIIGEKLYDILYAKDRLRHKMMHGIVINENHVGVVSDDLYKQLVHEYLSNRFKVESINKEAISVPRTFMTNVEGQDVFLRSKKDISLLTWKELEDWEDNSELEYLPEEPENY